MYDAIVIGSGPARNYFGGLYEKIKFECINYI